MDMEVGIYSGINIIYDNENNTINSLRDIRLNKANKKAGPM